MKLLTFTMCSMAKRKPSLSSSRPALPDEKKATAFISGEENPHKERVETEKPSVQEGSATPRRSKKKLSYPWEAPDILEERKRVINLRLPEPYYVKLKYIRQKTGKVAHQVCLDAVLPAIEAEIKKIIKEEK